jgi:hypothetical protein
MNCHDDLDQTPEKCWRVEQFAAWLGVCPKNIYNHMCDGSINTEAYRRWGNLVIFLPWRCKELLDMNTLFLRDAKDRKRRYQRRMPIKQSQNKPNPERTPE